MREAEVNRVITAAAGLSRGDRVLVRYGRFAGRVGVVEDVFRREDAGRERDVVWVRFRDRAVEAFDPKNLLRRAGEET
jgi:hypothetical protein